LRGDGGPRKRWTPAGLEIANAFVELIHCQAIATLHARGMSDQMAASCSVFFSEVSAEAENWNNSNAPLDFWYFRFRHLAIQNLAPPSVIYRLNMISFLFSEGPYTNMSP